jgi:hypothetical protein
MGDGIGKKLIRKNPKVEDYFEKRMEEWYRN